MSDNIGFKGTIKTSYMDSDPWWQEQKKPPDDAPNVLYIVLDDVGFGQIGCYGSLVPTPNIDSIAADGLRYSDFHVNAMCSPTRASLLTGCNNHSIGLGFLSNFNLGFPSLSGNVQQKYGYISETLLENGYSTFALGKWHLCNSESMSGAGPFDQWPLGRGFEKYYGFLSAMTGQFYPPLVRDNSIVDPPKMPEEGYHLSSDLVDQAIGYIGTQKSIAPDKPFFCYLAFGAMHGPHHAPDEYIKKFRGAFDEGYEAYREEVFTRQKKLGIVPEDAVLTDRNYLVKPWEGLSEWEKKVYARYMEAFAGYLNYTDMQIGRLLDYLKKLGQYENTLIVFVSDNGASAEGGPEGTVNEFYHNLSMKWKRPPNEEEYDRIGTEDTQCNYPAGWAWAGNTPLKYFKSWVHAGGIRVPFIISYPKRIKDSGSIRNQYHHVIDVNPTVLEICGISQPGTINGVTQEKKPGISMSYTFSDSDAPRQRKIQYYEMLGNRGIWCDGWKAVTNHIDSLSFDEDVWELYHTDEDFSEANDLAKLFPDKLNELISHWWYEAGMYGVLPLLESHFRKRDGFNFNNMLKFAPSVDRTHYTFYGEMDNNCLTPKLANKSFTIKTFATYKQGDEGVLICAGVNACGYVMYIEDDRLRFHLNYFGERYFDIEFSGGISPGNHEFAFDFVSIAPGKGLGKVLLDGKPGGSVMIEATPMFAVYGGIGIGRYSTSAIKLSHKGRKYYSYTGLIDRVEYDLARPVDNADMMLELESEHERA